MSWAWDRLALTPLSQGDTPLQHLRSPGSTGSSLRGLLAVTTVGLSPISRRQLSGHTSDWLDCKVNSVAYPNRSSIKAARGKMIAAVNMTSG